MKRQIGAEKALLYDYQQRKFLSDWSVSIGSDDLVIMFYTCQGKH